MPRSAPRPSCRCHGRRGGDPSSGPMLSTRASPLWTAFDVRPPDHEGSVRVVRLGYWGPNLLRVLGEHPDAHVRLLCDLDATRLARYGRRHPGARLTTRVGYLLDDDALDAILLATPVDSHYELAAGAL